MIHIGDCREVMRRLIADGVRVQCIVTSPPYFGLRDYGHPGQLGLESTPAEYVAGMVEVFGLARELLADDGTLWLTLGDSYVSSAAAQVPDSKNPRAGVMRPGNPEKNGGASNRDGVRVFGLPPKNLIGIPWRVAFALQSDGWYLRQDIIWHKPNPMPESVRDRCTKAHEYVFLLSKSARYYYDAGAISESATGRDPGNHGHKYQDGAIYGKAEREHVQSGIASVGARETRNRRSVWTIATQPYAEAHFATMPEALVEPCILAGSRPGDTIFDPFMGSGTVASVAQRLGRKWIGSELNPAYGELIERRTRGTLGLELAI